MNKNGERQTDLDIERKKQGESEREKESNRDNLIKGKKEVKD